MTIDLDFPYHIKNTFPREFSLLLILHFSNQPLAVPVPAFDCWVNKKIQPLAAE
jgi:hypothetical protein